MRAKALELWSNQGTLVICVSYGGAYFQPGPHYIFVLGKGIPVALAFSSLFRKLEMEYQINFSHEFFWIGSDF